MKYFEAEFVISPLSPDAIDLLADLAGEAGFESFEETPVGLKGYVQQQLFDPSTLQSALADFPFDNVEISYTIREAEYRDWNEAWENEGFDPIVVSRSEESGVWSENTIEEIIIHDGRHLPSEASSHLLEIEIDARQAYLPPPLTILLPLSSFLFPRKKSPPRESSIVAQARASSPSVP